MKIALITLFPELFKPLDYGVIGRALSREQIQLSTISPRDFSDGMHGHVDDTPYGGGAGMVLQAPPWSKAIQQAKAQLPDARVIALSPQGARFNQQHAKRLAAHDNLVFVCGRYAGFDQRLLDHDVDEELSIGDYVLSGGELPAMVIIDSICRLRDGILGNRESPTQDSFHQQRLAAPIYTKPQEFSGNPVPDVLLSGNHQAIARWREQQALLRTLAKRPDLIIEQGLSADERQVLMEICEQLNKVTP